MPDEDEPMDDGDEVEVEVKIAEKVGEFDEFVVWEHGGQVGGKEDPYVRGVREWIDFAEAMHCEEEDEGQEPGIDTHEENKG